MSVATGEQATDVALRDAVAECFAGSDRPGPPTVGIELELIPYRTVVDRIPALVAIAEVAGALGDLPHVSFEPGGQLELSPPPCGTVTETLGVLEALVDEATARARRAGIRLLAIGLEPWHATRDVALQLRTGRYLRMDQHFSDQGGTGQTFMRQTASVQICIGLARGDHGRLQWLAANRMAPILAAIFANAPIQHGDVVSHNGRRTAICALADPDRTGHRSIVAGRDPTDDYTRLATTAALIVADPSDLAGHLSTLFPPVRPRGTYLELRSIDSVPAPDRRAAATIAATLLVSPAASADVLLAADRVIDHQLAWELAAGAGVHDPRMRRAAQVILDVALRRLNDAPPGYLPTGAVTELRSVRSRIIRGRAPGDQLLDDLRNENAK